MLLTIVSTDFGYVALPGERGITLPELKEACQRVGCPAGCDPGEQLGPPPAPTGAPMLITPIARPPVGLADAFYIDDAAPNTYPIYACCPSWRRAFLTELRRGDSAGRDLLGRLPREQASALLERVSA